MQAVIKAGGKQFIVEPDQTLNVDLVADGTKKIEFEPLMVIDGDKVTIGTPVVAGITVSAEVVTEVKGEKIKVLKFKPKKRIKKLTGHRQHYSQIRITAIGSAKAKPAAAKVDAKPKAAAKPAAKAAA